MRRDQVVVIHAEENTLHNEWSAYPRRDVRVDMFHTPNVANLSVPV